MLKAVAGATVREIRLIEMAVGVELPEEYRSWLTSHNGGWPNSKNCWIEREAIAGSPLSLEVSNFLSASALLEYRQKYGTRIPSDLIPIANDDIGNLVCLGIVALTRNCVYLWDHENESATYHLLGQKTPPNHGNLHVIADSFSAFLDLLGPSN